MKESILAYMPEVLGTLFLAIMGAALGWALPIYLIVHYAQETDRDDSRLLVKILVGWTVVLAGWAIIAHEYKGLVIVAGVWVIWTWASIVKRTA